MTFRETNKIYKELPLEPKVLPRANSESESQNNSLSLPPKNENSKLSDEQKLAYLKYQEAKRQEDLGTFGRLAESVSSGFHNIWCRASEITLLCGASAITSLKHPQATLKYIVAAVRGKDVEADADVQALRTDQIEYISKIATKYETASTNGSVLRELLAINSTESFSLSNNLWFGVKLGANLALSCPIDLLTVPIYSPLSWMGEEIASRKYRDKTGNKVNYSTYLLEGRESEQVQNILLGFSIAEFTIASIVTVLTAGRAGHTAVTNTGKAAVFLSKIQAFKPFTNWLLTNQHKVGRLLNSYTMSGLNAGGNYLMQDEEKRDVRQTATAFFAGTAHSAAFGMWLRTLGGGLKAVGVNQKTVEKFSSRTDKFDAGTDGLELTDDSIKETKKFLASGLEINSKTFREILLPKLIGVGMRATSTAMDAFDLSPKTKDLSFPKITKADLESINEQRENSISLFNPDTLEITLPHLREILESREYQYATPRVQRLILSILAIHETIHWNQVQQGTYDFNDSQKNEVAAWYQTAVEARKYGIYLDFSNDSLQFISDETDKAATDRIITTIRLQRALDLNNEPELAPLLSVVTPEPNVRAPNIEQISSWVSSHYQQNESIAAAAMNPKQKELQTIQTANFIINELFRDLHTHNDWIHTYDTKLAKLFGIGLGISQSETFKSLDSILTDDNAAYFESQTEEIIAVMAESRRFEIGGMLSLVSNVLGGNEIYFNIVIRAMETGYLTDHTLVSQIFENISDENAIKARYLVTAMKKGLLPRTKGNKEKLSYLIGRMAEADRNCISTEFLAMKYGYVQRDSVRIKQRLEILVRPNGFSRNTLKAVLGTKLPTEQEITELLPNILHPAHQMTVLILAMESGIIKKDAARVHQFLLDYQGDHTENQYTQCVQQALDSGILGQQETKLHLRLLYQNTNITNFKTGLISAIKNNTLRDRRLILTYTQMLDNDSDILIAILGSRAFRAESDYIKNHIRTGNGVCCSQHLTLQAIKNEFDIADNEIAELQDKYDAMLEKLATVNEETAEQNEIDLDRFSRLAQGYTKILFISESATKELVNRYLTDRKNPRLFEDAISLFAFLTIDDLKILKEFYQNNPSFNSNNYGFSAVDFIQNLVGYLNAFKELGIGVGQFNETLREEQTKDQHYLICLGKRCFQELSSILNIEIDEARLNTDGRDIVSEWDTRYLGLLAAAQSSWPDENKAFFKLLLNAAIEGTTKGLVCPAVFSQYPTAETYGSANKEVADSIRLHNLNILKLMEEHGLNLDVWLNIEKYLPPKTLFGKGNEIKPGDLLRDFKSNLDQFTNWISSNDDASGTIKKELDIFLNANSAWGKIDRNQPNGNLVKKEANRKNLLKLEEILTKIREQRSGNVPIAVSDLLISIDHIIKYDSLQEGGNYTRYWRREIGRDYAAGNCAGGSTALESNASAIFEFSLDLGTIYQYVGHTTDDIKGYRRIFLGLTEDNEVALFVDTIDGTLAKQHIAELDRELQVLAIALGIRHTNINPPADRIKSKLGGSISDNYFSNSGIPVTHSNPDQSLAKWEPQRGWDRLKNTCVNNSILRLPHLLNTDAVEFLTNYGWDVHKISQYKYLAQGGFNVVYILTYEDKTYALRFRGAIDNIMTPHTLAIEIIGHNNAAEREFAPKIFAQTDKYILMEFVDGKHPTTLDLVNPVILGKILDQAKRMHALPIVDLKKSRVGSIQRWAKRVTDDQRWIPDVREAYQTYERLLEKLLRELEQTIDNEPPVFCHYDSKPLNVMLDKDDKVIFIDFEMCGTYHPIDDIAKLVKDANSRKLEVLALELYYGEAPPSITNLKKLYIFLAAQSILSALFCTHRQNRTGAQKHLAGFYEYLELIQSLDDFPLTE